MTSTLRHKYPKLIRSPIRFMITRVHIENFKSLVDFDLPPVDQRLGKFTCLVGMNGSGKSTVLQALDFLGQLMSGKFKDWLEHREWTSVDLVSRIPREPQWFEHGNSRVQRPWRPLMIIPFEVEFKLRSGETAVWRGKFNRILSRCTWEEICLEGQSEPILTHNEGVLQVSTGESKPFSIGTKEMIYEGSILSAFNFEVKACTYIKNLMCGLKSLEMLTPQAMRRRSRKGADIGYGGEQLAAFIGSLNSDDMQHLMKTLRDFYPQMVRLNTSTVQGGWKRLLGLEQFTTSLHVSAKNMNDGMLRVIAILAQAYSKHPVLLFDEIENGINPELVEKLVDFLVGIEKQVIVTTHSPMILNYMEDKVARESVYLLYRDEAGWTRSVRFFDQPETAAKLEALGPGEVYVDTNLTRLTKRLGRKAAKAETEKSKES